MPTSLGKRRIQKSQIENHGGMKREIEWYPRISEKNKIKTNLEIGNKLFTKYPLSPIGGPLVLDFKNVNNLDRNYKDLGPGKFGRLYIFDNKYRRFC